MSKAGKHRAPARGCIVCDEPATDWVKDAGGNQFVHPGKCLDKLVASELASFREPVVPSPPHATAQVKG